MNKLQPPPGNSCWHMPYYKRPSINGITAVAVLSVHELANKELTVYITTVPMSLAILTFYLGYKNVGEDELSDSEIKETALHAKVFGVNIWLFVNNPRRVFLGS